LEGNIAVGDDRQIGFAEFGDPQGRAVFWLHGTPGARRQIPMEARVYAEQRQIRLIGVDRPGIGSSTPYQYDTVFAFADDLRTIADTLGIDRMEVIGLSGGGPYTLACAAAMPDRVVAAGVIGCMSWRSCPTSRCITCPAKATSPARSGRGDPRHHGRALGPHRPEVIEVVRRSVRARRR
jgi:pimeloyl-ACP methyl ester carboxylesterase